MVELRDVQMQFEEKKVLDGFSLKVEPQERLVIMGQSGSGKSTILRLIRAHIATLRDAMERRFHVPPQPQNERHLHHAIARVAG